MGGWERVVRGRDNFFIIIILFKRRLILNYMLDRSNDPVQAALEVINMKLATDVKLFKCTAAAPSQKITARQRVQMGLSV